VEGAALFSLDRTKELTEKEESNLKFFSTVSILIGYLRNTLMTMTSSAPMGPYLLPPVNTTDLFRKKAENK
jgi:preprotein translocase subunit SecB